MHEKIYFRTYALLAISALLGVLPATSIAAPGGRKFTVGRSIYVGEAKTICVITGKWRSGKPFRYETWDKCAAMHVARSSSEALLASTSHGGSQKKPATLPKAAEVLEVSNGYSRVLLYRDADGDTQEVFVGD